jgi:hypothetical protein
VFSHGIQEDDASTRIRCDDGVADALEGPIEPFALGRNLLGCAFAVGDVTRDFRRAYDLAEAIADRGNREGDIDAPPPLGETDGLEVVRSLPRAEPIENFVLFVVMLRRNQHRDRPTDDLVGRVAEESFGAWIPGLNDPAQVFGDDRVLRRVDDGGKKARVLCRVRVTRAWSSIDADTTRKTTTEAS